MAIITHEHEKLFWVLSLIEGVKSGGKDGQFTGRCPAHDDRHPSLSIARGEKGVLLKCHAGCSLAMIVAAIRLKVSDLFYESANMSTLPQPQLVKTYPYLDEFGEILYEVCRYEPKDFRARRYEADGVVWNLDGVRLVPYRLPDLLDNKGRLILIVEGEKDVDKLWDEGFVATCGIGGCGKGWLHEYGIWLQGQHVCIIADRDKAGRMHARRTAGSLLEFAESLRLILDLDVPDGGDISDWFSEGGDARALKQIIAAASLWRKDEVKQSRNHSPAPHGANSVANESPIQRQDHQLAGVQTCREPGHEWF